MQLQIESVCSPPTPQTCVICSHSFQPNLARVIIYSDEQAQGDVCPTCLSQFGNFVRTCLQQTSVNVFNRAA